MYDTTISYMTKLRFQYLLLTAVLILLVLLYGLYNSTSKSDIQINSEYINGILTASRILFGIWAVVLGIKPTKTETCDKKTKEWQYKTIVSETFFFGFLFLIVDVLFLTLSAVNVFSQEVTLFFTALTFFYNALCLTITLHYYVFK